MQMAVYKNVDQAKHSVFINQIAAKPTQTPRVFTKTKDSPAPYSENKGTNE